MDPVDGAADSIELVKLEDVLVVKLAEVVGTSTDRVVGLPLMVVATNATEGVEVVLVVPLTVSALLQLLSKLGRCNLPSRGATTPARTPVDTHKATLKKD